MTAVLRAKPRRDQLVEAEIGLLTAEGLGEALLEVEPAPGRPQRSYALGVRRALPGERVQARIRGRRRGVFTASVEQLLRPSPQRIDPRCLHFDPVDGLVCGGCSLQSLAYADQLALKQRTLAQLIVGAGLDGGCVAPALGAADAWYYRNKMELSFGQDAGGQLVLGLHPAGAPRRVLSLEQCFLLSPFASAFVPRWAAWARERGLAAYDPSRGAGGFLRTLTLREGKRTGERMLEVTTSHDSEVQLDGALQPAAVVAERLSDASRRIAAEVCGELTSIYWTQHRAVRGEPTRLIEHHLYGQRVLHEELHLDSAQQLRFEIHPRAFFQPNTRQAEVLYGQVLEASGVRAGATRTALDLYCGTGTIALCLAPHCERVIGIELQEDAVDNARRNALRNGIGNVAFHAGDAVRTLEQVLPRGERVDLLVVDPPRSGLLGTAIHQINTIGAPRLVYVSCNPRALVRDLVGLAHYGYRLARIQPVDLFPQTAHLECVATLDRG